MYFNFCSWHLYVFLQDIFTKNVKNVKLFFIYILLLINICLYFLLSENLREVKLSNSVAKKLSETTKRSLVAMFCWEKLKSFLVCLKVFPTPWSWGLENMSFSFLCLHFFLPLAYVFQRTRKILFHFFFVFNFFIFKKWEKTNFIFTVEQKQNYGLFCP